MDIAKQYIVQCINCAANNLRLSSEKIEVVAMLKEYLSNSEDLERTIDEMKKLTRFSKFAIKLSEVCGFIFNSQIDFLKISDKFKEHTHLILIELSNLLDIVTPQECSENLIGKAIVQEEISVELKEKELELPIETNDVLQDSLTSEGDQTDNQNKKSESDLLKEELILGDIKNEDELTFEKFEKEVLRPIKELDVFLKKLLNFEHDPDDLILYAEMMYNNAELSEKIGFDIITNMHIVFADTLSQIKENKLLPDCEIIEGLRSCLIVIAGVIRSKDVDITSYLNNAEKLGKQIKTQSKG